MQLASSNPRRPRSWRRAVTGCAIAIAAAGIAAAVFWWFGSQGFVERIEAEVRAGVPLGSTRAEAEAWARRNYGFIPTYHDDVTGDRFVGRTIPECAGVPANELGGLVRTTAKRNGVVGNALNLVDPDHVFVFFLIDREDLVCGYYFLSLHQLRVMEQDRLRIQKEDPR